MEPHVEQDAERVPTLQTTKQMLDELDALMEKMLSLPVNELEDGSAFPEEVVKPTASTLAATLTLLRETPPRERRRRIRC